MTVGKNRSGARTRGYNDRWEKAAATFRARHPWCLGCLSLGRRVRAELVDHVEPHKGNPKKFWDTGLWQSSCRWHHDVVKQKLEMMFAHGECLIADLWLNSALAVKIARSLPRREAIGVDGWPTGEQSEMAPGG
jgi:5-methylcytosine-specific restriction enzyme A